jgi:hypothetical protein
MPDYNNYMFLTMRLLVLLPFVPRLAVCFPVRKVWIKRAQAVNLTDRYRFNLRPTALAHHDRQVRGWKRKSKWQDTSSQYSPFGPITSSSSISTALPKPWMGPSLGDNFSVDTQCGNGTFSEVGQDWIDPMSVSFWNGGLEQAYLCGYSQQSIR